MPRSCYALAILFALSSQAPAQTFVAATNATVRSETLESPTVPPSHSIFIINNSTVPITVFGYTLSECENVKVRCDTRRTSFRVPPRARRMLVRVEPRSQDLGFYYRFNFSWHADSSAAKTVLGAMADAGDASAAARLAAIRRADSERAADVGYTELTVDAWAALSDEQLSMHAQPESVLVAPGQEVDLDRLRVFIVNANGQIVGHTRWLRMELSGGVVELLPPRRLLARRPGRALLHLALGNDLQSNLTHRVADIDVPIIVPGDAGDVAHNAPAFTASPASAEPPDPHAPVFAGRAIDTDSRAPLACLHVLLEGPKNNTVAETITDSVGAFSMRAPRVGSYRLAFGVNGWGHFHGDMQAGAADEVKRGDYAVSFSDVGVGGDTSDSTFQHAEPITMRSQVTNSAVPIGGFSLGGSMAHPVLGVVIGSAAPRSVFVQYAVDSTGKVDPRSIVVPSGTSANDKASLKYLMPRIGYKPARFHGAPTCEMMRLQVNFTPQVTR